MRQCQRGKDGCLGSVQRGQRWIQRSAQRQAVKGLPPSQTASISSTGPFFCKNATESRAETLHSLFSSWGSGGKTRWFKGWREEPVNLVHSFRLSLRATGLELAFAVRLWPWIAWPCCFSRLAHTDRFLLTFIILKSCVLFIYSFFQQENKDKHWARFCVRVRSLCSSSGKSWILGSEAAV